MDFNPQPFDLDKCDQLIQYNLNRRKSLTIILKLVIEKLD